MGLDTKFPMLVDKPGLLVLPKKKKWISGYLERFYVVGPKLFEVAACWCYDNCKLVVEKFRSAEKTTMLAWLIDIFLKQHWRSFHRGFFPS